MGSMIHFVCLAAAILASVYGYPTMYKYNENKVLEPDLVPVSSTVIPLPVYQVGYGFNVALKDSKLKRPDGPVHLITAHDRKKYVPELKEKSKEASTLKKEN